MLATSALRTHLRRLARTAHLTALFQVTATLSGLSISFSQILTQAILFQKKHSHILTMPKVFLIKRKKLVPNWCPVTPPPSPDDDETVPENLSMKTSASSHTDSLIAAAISAGQSNKSLSFLPALLPPPPINAHSASIPAHHHHLAHNLHQDSVLNLKRSINHDISLDEPCAVDLSVSAKTDTSSSSHYSPQHYSRSSSLSSPFSYSNSESEFEIKGKFCNTLILSHYSSFAPAFALTHLSLALTFHEVGCQQLS